MKTVETESGTFYYFTTVVSNENRDAWDLEIIKLTKKAGKYGFDLRVKKTIQDDGYTKIDFKLNVPIIKYKNYEYVATLERENPKFHKEGVAPGNLVFTSQKHKGEDFSGYFKEGNFRCDHCNKNRYRLEVHLFRDPDTKAELMIATTCSREYFGVDVDKVINQMRRTIENLGKKIKKMEKDDKELKANKLSLKAYLIRLYDYRISGKYEYLDKSEIPPFDFNDFLDYWTKKRIENPKDRKINNQAVAVHMYKPLKKFTGLVDNAMYNYLYNKVYPPLYLKNRKAQEVAWKKEREEREEARRKAEEEAVANASNGELVEVGEYGSYLLGRIRVTDIKFVPNGPYGAYYTLYGLDKNNTRLMAFVGEKRMRGDTEKAVGNVAEISGSVGGKGFRGEIKINKAAVRLNVEN